MNKRDKVLLAQVLLTDFFLYCTTPVFLAFVNKVLKAWACHAPTAIFWKDEKPTSTTGCGIDLQPAMIQVRNCLNSRWPGVEGTSS